MKIILPKTEDPRFHLLAKRILSEGKQLCQKPESTPVLQLLHPASGEEACLAALEGLPRGSVLVTGRKGERLATLAKKKEVRLLALLETERYLTRNAAATAEGVLAELIRKSDRCLEESCVLVLGYGNCGSKIARLLWLCGCEVWVWSRERGQKLASRDGFNLCPITERGLGMFDCVINTVPAEIFPPSLLATMQRGSLFFQVASGLSGICPEEANAMGIRFHPLHGLPGIYAPATEADAVWDEIEPFLNSVENRCLP